MLINKKNLLIIVLLCLENTIKTTQVNVLGWVNNDTGVVLNAQGETNLPIDLNTIFNDAQTIDSSPSLTMEVVTAFNNLATGRQLTPQENVLMGSMFTTIDIINTFQDFLGEDTNKSINPAKQEDVTSFIVWSTGRALANNKPIMDMLKEDIANVSDESNRIALAKGVVQHLAEKLIQKISNKTTEEIQATNTGLAMINRIVTGKTTFIDRCYIKVVKALTSAVNWVRSLFGKGQIQKSLESIDNVDILLDEKAALSALDYATTLSKKVQDKLTPDIASLEANTKTTSEWTKTTSIQITNEITPEIVNTFSITTCVSTIMVNGFFKKIKTYLTQNITNALDADVKSTPFIATITQLIETPEGPISKSYRLTGDTTENVFNTAKTIIESSMITLKEDEGLITSEVDLLEKFEFELIKTGKISREDCTQKTLEALDANNEKDAIIIKVVKTVFDLKPNIDLATTINLIKLDLLQSTPNNTSLSEESISLYTKLATKVFHADEDLLASLETIPGTEKDKIDALIQLKKQDIANSLFNNYILSTLVDPKGNYKFNINELAKDNIMVTAAENRLNDLLTNASMFDRKTIGKLLEDIKTAVANRPKERTPEEQDLYNKLTNELTTIAAENNPSAILNWAKTLSSNDYSLVESDIDSAIFTSSLVHTDFLDLTDFTDAQLIELKTIFTNFITASENFGYGSLLESDSLAKKYHDILVKSGINSPEQQQALLNDVAIIENELLKNLTKEYNTKENQKNWLDKIINNNESIIFDALSNESKINFFNELPDLTKNEIDTYIAKALENVINKAKTPEDLLNLQKETFAQNDILLQALQDKIKTILIDYYKYLTPLDQYNFKRSLLDPKDFTNYSRAFKTLSLSDQQEIAYSLGIDDTLLNRFQKEFLADKIFYAKTIEELNILRTDIKSINEKTPDYFTNQDIAGKHGFTTIGDAIIIQVQTIIEKTVKSGAAIHASLSTSEKDYFKFLLLNITSGDIYATAFRELPLTAQHELAQVFNIDEDTEFKEFQKKIFLDEVGVATTPTELALLQEVGNSIGIDQTTMDTLNKRLNKAIESGTVSEEIPSAHGIPLDPNVIVPNQEDPNSGTKTKENPSVEDIKKDFNDQSLSSNDFHNAAQSEEERKRAEKEYEEQELAERTEEAAEQQKVIEEAK